MKSRTGFARAKASPGARRPELSRPNNRPSSDTAGASRSLLNRAIALLARRDHSRGELSRKLSRYVDEDGAGQVDRVLEDLERNGLISDERFAATTARTRAHRFGDARIRHDLRRLGVADETTATVMQTLAGSEVARAREVWSKRFGTLPASAAERARQSRFLQSRGFALDSIFRVLRGEANDDGSQPPE